MEGSSRSRFLQRRSASLSVDYPQNMQVLIALENHYEYGPDGRIYAEGPAKYSFWSHYLNTFDEVIVLARVGAHRGTVCEEARADGPRVSFRALPDYHGPWQYLQNLPTLKTRVKEA